MKKPYYIIGILVAIIIVLLVLLLWPKPSQGPTTSNPSVTASTPTTSTTTTKPAASITYTPASAKDMIKVDSPIVNATIHVTTPISVTGQAKGSWFFEGSFPAELTDAKGTVIGQGAIKAQSTWMTESFVQFNGVIAYTHEPAAGTRGYVILKKDNPSGLPQNAASVTIPVIFQ